jgi:hypothetical protein
MREHVLLFCLLGLVLTAKLAPGVGRLLGHEKSPVAYNGVQNVMALHARCVVTSSSPSRRHPAEGR